MIRGGGGSIINVSSLAGTRGSRQSHAYAMAKGGVISLTQSLAVTYGPQGIRANAIAPGAIDTPMVHAGGLLLDEAAVHAMMTHLPLGRVGLAEDVARVALFLASDESRLRDRHRPDRRRRLHPRLARPVAFQVSTPVNADRTGSGGVSRPRGVRRHSGWCRGLRR